MSASHPLGVCWIVLFDFTSLQKFMVSAPFIYDILILDQAIDWNTTVPSCKSVFQRGWSLGSKPAMQLWIEGCTGILDRGCPHFYALLQRGELSWQGLCLFSLPPFKLPVLAENILDVKYAILPALQGLALACGDASPHFSSSDPAVLMHSVVSVLSVAQHILLQLPGCNSSGFWEFQPRNFLGGSPLVILFFSQTQQRQLEKKELVNVYIYIISNY